MNGAFQYNTDLFKEETIERLSSHFTTLLEAIVKEPERRVSELPLLSAAEREQLLIEWNQTTKEYPQQRCIHELFEEQVERTPDAVAVVFEEQELTYGELNRRANQLAHYLRSLGVGPEVLVGLMVERSIEMVVGLLGILKAGGAYLPLDPEYPQQRLSFMLADAQLSILLTQQHLRAQLPPHHLQLLSLDEEWAQLSDLPGSNLDLELEPEHPAYAIYTSGSTGQPKCALNTHQGISNRLVWMQETYSLSQQDVVLQKTPLASMSRSGSSSGR